MDGTPTYPEFEVTLIHTRNGLEFIRATIEGRLCNVHYAAAVYMAGERAPHYPMPALRPQGDGKWQRYP